MPKEEEAAETGSMWTGIIGKGMKTEQKRTKERVRKV